jgi:membrane protein implicated in regulation of membrane protease activity
MDASVYSLYPLFSLVAVILIWALAAVALYWVIRLAVRHALQDVAGRNRGAEYLLTQPTAPPPRAD